MTTTEEGPGPDWTLRETQDWLRDKVVEHGTHCPCCTQYAKVYRRKINTGMVLSLFAMYQAGRGEFIHLPTTISARSREEGKLRYWGLVEELDEPRADGGRAGWWRVTPKGIGFLLNESTLPKYALIYDGRCLGWDGPPVDVIDALGTNFNYHDLMGGL